MFKIGDVFEIRPTKSYKMTNNDLFKHLGSIPLVSNTSVNNGITNNLSLAPTEDGNIITFSDTTTADSIFYQPNKFIGYSHVQGLYPRNPEGWDQDSLLYVVSLFRKQAKGRFSYAIKFNRKIASDMPLALPVTRTGEIDFAYMSERMQELKAERMQELKAYLSVAGFDDCTLSTEEATALKHVTSGNLKFYEFRIGDVFEIKTSAKKFNAVDIKFGGDHPYVARGESNNGIRAYVNLDTKYLNEGHTLSFGQDTATVFYQEQPYFTGDKIKVFKLKHGSLNAQIAPFFITSLRKVFSLFSWGTSSFSEKILNETKISLPITANGTPDYSLMEVFIRAIKKMCIAHLKDVFAHEEEVYGKVIAE